MVFNSFQDVAENGGFTSEQVIENAPGVGDLYKRPDIPPVTPTQPAQNNPPRIPEWGQTLTARVAKIEQKMATKADVSQLEQKVDAGFAKLEQMIQQR